MYRITHEYDPSEAQHPDYYPLTVERIKELLGIAVACDDPSVTSDIQSRLQQGIVGITCPREIDDATEAAASKIDRLYLSFIKYPERYDVGSVAQKLLSVMQNPEAWLRRK